MTKTTDIFNSATLINGHKKVDYVKYLEPAGVRRPYMGRVFIDYYMYQNPHSHVEYNISIRYRLLPYLVTCVCELILSFFSCLWNGGLKRFSLSGCFDREVTIGHLYYYDKIDGGITVKELFADLVL